MEMDVEMKEVEIISRETIKPSSPTPEYLRNFTLCLLDQLAPLAYGSLVLFYSLDDDFSNTSHQGLRNVTKRCLELKRSLSETLTKFYPLAGRIKGDSLIECNDSGAVFVQARVDCLLSRFLEKPEAEMVRKFIPVEINSPEARTGSLLQVQATFFTYGGLAIGVCVSNKIADAVTLMTFLQNWAASCSGSVSGNALLPIVNAASIFPPQNFSFVKQAAKISKEKHVTKRFIFNELKIATLKAQSTSESVKDQTREEAVTALIWKCAMNASRSNSEHSGGLSILSQSVSIRKRVVPPLPEEAIGNLVGHFASQAIEGDFMDLKRLVHQLRKGVKDFNHNYLKKLRGDDAFKAISKSFAEAGNLLEEGKLDFYVSTSLCKFPFYDIDFGLGRPTWVTVPSGVFKNVFVMMDTRDGDGIEVWVSLSEEDMLFFERDQDLLACASLDPSVTNSIKLKSAL